MKRWLCLPLIALAAGTVLAQDAPPRRSLADLNAEEMELSIRMGRNRVELARILGAIQLFGRDPPPALLADPREVKDAVRAAILMRAIAPTLAARAHALSVEAEHLALLRRKAAAANGELFTAQSERADRISRLEGMMSDAEALSPPSLRDSAPTTGTNGASQAARALVVPVVGPRSAGFGGRLADGARSRGWALQPAPGANVVAPAAAVVDYAGPLNGWGLVLILRAGGGCHMVLSGLGKISVTAGQTVAAGQVVGAMASDGSAARELYFEVRLGGDPVDPAKLISAAPRKTASGA
jgi:septal ring factor EnvC (AmiA/AmiB activator)